MPILLEAPQDALNRPVIVVVEDNDEDFYTFWRILGQLETAGEMSFSYPFLRFLDGDDVLDYIFGEGDCSNLDSAIPILMLLDLNLPGTDGREVIRQVKGSPQLKKLPITVLTTSDNTLDVEACYACGVNSYIHKALSMARMRKTLKTVLQYWFEFTLLPKIEPLESSCY